MAVAVGLFGMSTKYWMMIVTRCIGGGIGGTSTCVDSARSPSKAHFSLNINSAVRVMAGEMSDKDSRSNLFTLLTVSQPTEQHF